MEIEETTEKSPLDLLTRKTTVEIYLFLFFGTLLIIGCMLLLFYDVVVILIGFILFSVIFMLVRYLWLNILYLRRLKLMKKLPERA